MAYQRKDHFYRKAKAEGRRSRAAFKLDELLDRFRLARPGDAVLDFGAFPGGWTETLSRTVGRQGLVIAVDLKPMPGVAAPNIRILEGDATSPEIAAKVSELLSGRPVDAVFSDAAPNLTGVHHADYARSQQLTLDLMQAGLRFLRPGGHFCAKVFPGATPHELVSEAKRHFRDVRMTRPKATRQESAELYLVAREKRDGP
ncbi:MAG: RlmE family RNA methyltransferase [Deltaproteobacteria bacterium]|nr:RlmE family RNA methyltransferase [Deltaproteobacteria bacterium]